VHAISNARYSTLLNDKEQLEQKYLHLSQIIESESTAKWQYSKQCEEFSAEIKKLRQEICLLKRQESRSNHLRLVLSKSAAIVDTIVRQQRHRQRKQQQQQQQRPELSRPPLGHSCPAECSPRAPGGVAAAACRQQSLHLERTRSIDQELEEHELAVRRTRRSERLHRRQSEALRSLVRPAGQARTSAAASAEAPRRRLAARRDSAGQPSGPTVGQLSADEEADEQALSIELKSVVEALNNEILLSKDCLLEAENSEELRKIKKVQGFFRGWLCRRRWKQIVHDYIKSPHAESMRKRNNLVFRMVECEEEYVEQLTLLISAFLRPMKMAASSQRPALNHDELNSIFLNSETLLFLHQIFLKGLSARMESWPTLVLGDLFTMLLPMLTIYQEYVRNHHFSLQVLAECKQREQFSSILRRLEEKPQLNGRTLETFLTYPMHQVTIPERPPISLCASKRLTRTNWPPRWNADSAIHHLSTRDSGPHAAQPR